VQKFMVVHLTFLSFFFFFANKVTVVGIVGAGQRGGKDGAA
jgi:hypothetical protein